MRDSNRIDYVLSAVREVWTQYPDMRLGQLIVNAIQPDQPNADIFHTEDFPLVNQLGRLHRQLTDSPAEPLVGSCSIEELSQVTGPDFHFESFDGWTLAVNVSVTDYPHSWYAKIKFDGVSFIDCPCDFSHATFRRAKEVERNSISERIPLDADDTIVAIDAETLASMDQQTFFIVCENVSITQKSAGPIGGTL